MAERETERVIVTEGRGGGGSTAIVALIVVALLVVLFLLFGRDLLSSSSVPDKIEADVDINAPASGGGEGN
jgi:predicted metalloprotease